MSSDGSADDPTALNGDVVMSKDVKMSSVTGVQVGPVGDRFLKLILKL